MEVRQCDLETLSGRWSCITKPSQNARIYTWRFIDTSTYLFDTPLVSSKFELENPEDGEDGEDGQLGKHGISDQGSKTMIVCSYVSHSEDFGVQPWSSLDSTCGSPRPSIR